MTKSTRHRRKPPWLIIKAHHPLVLDHEASHFILLCVSFLISKDRQQAEPTLQVGCEGNGNVCKELSRTFIDEGSGIIFRDISKLPY